nr:DUF4245 domain-containing protein [Arthrobacter roseus]
MTPKQAKRANATVTGMLISTGVCVALFLGVFFLNPASKAEVYERNVDVQQVAQSAASAAEFTPASPKLTDEWTSNFARWNSASGVGVDSWEVGYLTPKGEFIQLSQTDTANPTWIASQTESAPVTGEREIAGVTWELRDRPEDDASLIADLGDTTIILRGTADLGEFDTLATAVINQQKQ